MTTTNTSIAVAESAPRHALDEAGMAAALDEQWDRAQAGLVEIIRFGAMLAQVARELEAPILRSPAGERKIGTWGGHNKGTGLKAWLAEHCPGINYKTAYGYMVAANGLAREARLAADVPLLSLMGADPIAEPRAEKLRARVYKVLADASLSLLKAAGTSSPPPAPTGGAREGAGRPPKTAEEAWAEVEADPEQNAIKANNIVAQLYEWGIRKDGFGCLADADLFAIRSTLRDVTDRADVIIAARKQGRSAPGRTQP